MSLLKNLSFNYLATAVSIGSNFILLPLYMHLLGDKWFGVLSLVLVIQSTLLILDSGVSTTLRREFAVKVSTQKYERIEILRTFEKAYIFSLLGIGGVLFYFLPDWILWLVNVDSEDREPTRMAFQLLVPIALFQILFFFYVSGFWGLDDHKLASASRILFIIFRNGFVVFVLLFFDSLKAFLLWQIISSAFLILLVRHYLYRRLSKTRSKINKSYFNLDILRNSIGFTRGLFFLSCLSMITLQSDKLILSHLLEITVVGYYSIAFLLCQSAVTAAVPIGATYFPRLTAALSERGGTRNYAKLCESAFVLITCVSIFSATIIFLFSNSIILLWTGNNEAQRQLTGVLKFLCIGSAAQALQVLTYNIALARKETKLLNFISVGMLFITLPLYYVMTAKYFLQGAAITWMIHNLVITPIHYYFIVVKITGLNYFRQLILRAAKISATIAFTGSVSYYIFSSLNVLKSVNLISTFILMLVVVVLFHARTFVMKLLSDSLTK